MCLRSLPLRTYLLVTSFYKSVWSMKDHGTPSVAQYYRRLQRARGRQLEDTGLGIFGNDLVRVRWLFHCFGLSYFRSTQRHTRWRPCNAISTSILNGLPQNINGYTSGSLSDEHRGWGDDLILLSYLFKYFPRYNALDSLRHICKSHKANFLLIGKTRIGRSLIAAKSFFPQQLRRSG